MINRPYSTHINVKVHQMYTRKLVRFASKRLLKKFMKKCGYSNYVIYQTKWYGDIRIGYVGQPHPKLMQGYPLPQVGGRNKGTMIDFERSLQPKGSYHE